MDRTDSYKTSLNSLELAGRTVELSLNSDNSAPSLVDLTGVLHHNTPTASGYSDHDYPNLSGLAMGLANFTQIKTLSKVPLPPEIMEHFGHMQCHCMMGLFTEISRAWLTIDSDIYVWTYEHGSDVAYYDGLNDTIVSVGLVKPKPGVFHSYVQYLLVLTTTVDIVLLGITFTSTIHLVPDPVFTLPTEGVCIQTIVGTDDGRIFLGGRDGSLFEIIYQAESSWFGKRCKKVNHSTGPLSFLVPSFINVAFSDDDPICKISIDNSRHILYTLTVKGSIEVYDLGETGTSISRVARISQASVVQQAMNIVKTFDSINFHPIISISAMENCDSPHIHLVAVSQSGVRLYFTTVGLQNYAPNQRPFSLQLAHVRLPPGFSANFPTVKPKMVHMADYRENCLVLISSPSPDFDQLWCLSSDPFPFTQNIAEAHTVIQLDGPAWALAEIYSNDDLTKSVIPMPPLVVRQHMVKPRKYVVLTAQGAHIFIKLRPVDMLRQLLVDSHGPDSDAVKAYFQVQKEEQACATSLILACIENVQHAEIAEWAARAFFMYGGEPKLLKNTLAQTTRNPAMFSPGMVSTPANFGSPYQQSVTQSTLYSSPNKSMEHGNQFLFSPKHYALYLYLSRILRPIWNALCVQKFITETKSNYFTSSITSGECICILTHLLALKSFLHRNTQKSFLGNLSNIQSIPNRDVSNNTTGKLNITLNDVQIEERQSLDALKFFVNHCCEVLGLWKILTEHQMHLLIATLPKDCQNVLLNTTFKDLILFGQDICSALIVSLINNYLNDNSSIDTISSKLRDVCPTLYKSEDAACSKNVQETSKNNVKGKIKSKIRSCKLEKKRIMKHQNTRTSKVMKKKRNTVKFKEFIEEQFIICPNCLQDANEILLTAKSHPNRDEREVMLLSALKLYKEVAPNLNLAVACQKFIGNQFYTAVIDLCVTCAKKIDPEGVAIHYYKNKEPTDDQDGYQIFTRRMQLYKEAINMLEQLYSQNSIAYTADIPSSPGPPQIKQTLPIPHIDNTQLTKKLIQEMLESKDELLHVALYDWMVNKQMFGELLDVKEKSLEHYLLRATRRTPHKSQVYDLLWKYYEQNDNHAAAAKILNSLATQPGNNIMLNQRLEYLSRAVMCMRSDKVGYAPNLGIFLRELEDKIDIARVQELILNHIINKKSLHPQAEEAVKKLNSHLYDITQLYADFADPFDLWECKLAIINCSGHNDSTLVQSIWVNIIQNELDSSTGTPDDRMTQVLNKVKALAREYNESELCFPLEFLIRELEQLSCKLKCNYILVPNAFFDMKVSISHLINTYHRLTSTQEIIWLKEGNQFHVYKSLAEIIRLYIEHSSIVLHSERRKIIAHCQDVIAGILSTLYSKPNTEELVKTLRNLQSKLNRL